MAILDIPRFDLNRIISLITVRQQPMHSILPNIFNNPTGSQISYHMVIECQNESVLFVFLWNL